MNISSEISSIHGFVSFDCFFSNGTKAGDFSFIYIFNILLSCPLNSYVIGLILKGIGNGLAAEFFNLNLSVCEILLCLDTLIVFVSYKCTIPWSIVAFLDGILVVGHPLFECLICVERYLAVVHPVTFLKYKPLRYRLMSSAVIWMLTFVFGGFNAITLSYVVEVYIIFLIIPFFIFLSVKLFCCLAVLRALKQSGPGERGREEENHMKRRAFHLILIATLSMVIIYLPYFFIVLIKSKNESMFMFVGQICFTFAGLVQPVLFLYRVGKLNFITCS